MMLDSDLAQLYRVMRKNLNKSVKPNAARKKALRLRVSRGFRHPTADVRDPNSAQTTDPISHWN
jgi:hypothetical protein